MESFKFLTDSRQQCLAEITAIDNKISELNPEHNELLIIAYYEESIELIKEFKEIKVRCLNFNAHSSKSKSIELNDSVNDLFKDACARIKSIVLGLNKSESRTPQPGANLAPLADNHLRLPPLSIPKLSGENDFEAFYGLFETLVDKQPFDNLVKFHHLYANLSEEPRQIIVSYLPITADGYVAARDALVAHYRNNRRNGMKKLLNILNANVLPNNYSSKDLADLIKNFQGSYAAVLQLNLPIEELHNFLLMTTLYSKLPVGLRRAYEESLDDPRAISTHTNLLNFLQEKVQVSDLVTLVSNDNPRSVKSTGGNSTPTTQNKHPTAQRTSRTLLTQSSQNNKSEIKCPYCKDHHRLYKCNEFLKCSVNKRKAFVSKHELCVRCLNGHSNACKYNFACRLCHSVDHNVLLCAAANGPASPPPDSSAIDPSLPGTSSQNNTVQSMNANISGQTLLPTASVLVRDNLGKFIPMRAVIDSGSQACFLSRSAFQRLQLKPRSDNTFIQGISGNTKSHGKVSLHIRSPISGHETLLTDALIIPQICENLPTDDVSVAVIGQAANLRVADPLWFQSGKIDLLLGANILSKILLDQPNIIMQSLTAQSTMFGYILMGSTGNKARLSTTLLAIDHELTSTVQKIWELDQLPQKNPLQSPEEIECEQHYVKTHSRDAQGRYVVRLPWKTNSVPLCENKFSPIKQLYNLEKSLQRKPSAASAYRDFFNAYIEMEVLVPGQDPQSPYILPHHAVFKADSSTTAVRPVFNCSALDVNGHSLNSMLLKGPNLVQDITDVLLSFRLQPVAITADISKMYTSILLDRRDHPAQQLLWRTDPESAVIDHYNLTRVIFGMTSSSFLALRTIQQLIADQGDPFPLACKVLNNNCYVDDVVSCFSSVEEATRARKELIDLLQLGGFQLRKFSSSHDSALLGLEDTSKECIDVTGDANLKILGLHWSPISDCFKYTVVPFNGKMTKRDILSYTAMIYDVAGLLAPITLAARSYIKELWLQGYDWDAPIHPPLSERWIQFSREMPRLNELRINRYIPVSECAELNLIGFCDGSLTGFAAVFYLQCVFNNHAEMHLIRAKARVVPIQPQLTVPRIELQGAKLLIDLYISLLPRLSDLPIDNVIFCSDSTIVLQWIRTPAHLLKMFVGNRISHIQSHSNPSQWRHVPSGVNCADPASRGLAPSELIDCELWWSGPAFLRTVPILWPTQCQLSGDVPELKTVNVATLVAKTAQREDVIERFSTLTRMNRVMSYVFRFIDKCRKKPANSGTLTTEEIKKTLNRVIIIVQNNHQAATDLKGLTPFIDQAGICRVGGRLKNAPLPYDARHPIILPANVHLSLLICRHAHGQTLHGGTALTRAYIQNQFWIVGITRLVKRVKRDCSKCSRFSNRPPEPLMADLPKDRFLIDKPFANTSCDFAGYFMVRDQLLRTRAPKLIKTYVCIFTCMSTRAVHFEIVQDLTSEAFLAALERFVARRGLPSLIFSDLGTNFVGGNRTLTDIKNSLLKGDDLTSLCASRQITFQFNCPVAAWKNGITERIVSLMKFHLNRTMGTHHLTYPEFMTLITQIEAAINSRPLIPLSVDPNDHILTPGHFLTGSNLYAVPDYDYSQMKPNTLSRWQHVKNLFQQFWKQWSHGYLQTLISRSKWTKNVPDLEVGTVVLVKGDQTPPLMWPLALIKSFKPSADNVRRVAVIKTAHGDLTRPVNKLIPLLNVD